MGSLSSVRQYRSWVVLGTLLPACWALLLLAWPRPLAAQGANGISQPAADDVISGIVIIEGTATDPHFLRYELAFYQEFNSGAGWIVFAEGERPVSNGTLAIWDTTVGRTTNAPVFPDGAYQLRLRVVRTDYNYTEYFVRGLLISNSEPTPTPTVTETVTAVPTLLVTPFVVTPVPALLPTLTPFPTPTRPAAPVDDHGDDSGGGRPVSEPEAAPRQGVLGQLASLELERVSRAFWQGATLAFYLFIILFLYIPVRGLLRRLRRLAWRVWQR
jgi:hypothetical protein